MISRFDAYAERVRQELRKAFAEDHSSREVAASFAVGVFITMLPTLGVGLLVFVVLAWLFERLNKVALFASVVVFNPVVKWGVYAASFTLGVFILGPVPGGVSEISLHAGPEIVIRLLVGNLILAVVAAVPSYFICHKFVTSYRARDVVKRIEDVITTDDEEEGIGSGGS